MRQLFLARKTKKLLLLILFALQKFDFFASLLELRKEINNENLKMKT